MYARSSAGAPDRAPTGLTAREAARRLAAHGPNELPPPPREGIGRRVARSLTDPLVLLLLVAAGIAGLGLGEHADAIAIGAIVLLNSVIGVVEEGRATHALEALRAMEAPEAVVVRDGARLVVPARELVAEDLVVLEAGDRVPADIVVTGATALQVDEAILTGESLPVARRPGEGLSAGTFVTRGSGSGVVVRTGATTALGRIAASLREERPRTPLQRELGRVAARLGSAAVVIAIGVGILVFVRLDATGEAFEQALLVGVALAVAAVPEGLATVVTIALALGVRRMARAGAIIRRLPAVETLGATTVIATDKTGTLTENAMRVTTAATPDGVVEPAELPAAARARAVRIALLCNDAEGTPPVGDPVDVALLALGSEEERSRALRESPRVAALPFDPARRRMTTVHRGGLVAMKGAPETVLARCARYVDAAGEQPLGPAVRERILETVTALAAGGTRVLALADRLAPGARRVDDTEEELTFVALIGMRDPVRAEAAGAVAEARAAGVRVVMVTGDHPGTARAIASEIGIDAPDVHARVDPQDKLALVRSLRDAGEVVAVTGDGVNDAPALRHADIGVAMGRAGSDVAREAGDMVITDDNLATIVTAIRQGRGIFDNIRKVVDYLVAGNIAEIAVVVAVLIWVPALAVPLTPLQLLWINLVTDGPPALMLGVDAIDPALMGKPPRARTFRLLGVRRVGGLAVRAVSIAGAALSALAAGRLIWELSWADARGLMFTTLVVAHLFYAFAVRASGARRARANLRLAAAVGGGIALQVIVTTWEPARSLFDALTLTPAMWVFAGAAGVVPTAVIIAATRRRAPASGAGA